jgi:hypothetical protein
VEITDMTLSKGKRSPAVQLNGLTHIMTTSQQPQTLTIPEAGKMYFGLCRNASYAAAKRGEIPTIKIGRLYRVPIRALEQRLDETLKTDA